MDLQLVRYRTADGDVPFTQWFDGLRDVKAKTAITRRLDRAARGNLGDHKFERDGVWEMRLDMGPGYRMYYFRQGDTLVILLCGGDKSSQKTDLDRAVEYRKDYLERMQ